MLYMPATGNICRGVLHIRRRAEEEAKLDKQLSEPSNVKHGATGLGAFPVGFLSCFGPVLSVLQFFSLGMGMPYSMLLYVGRTGRRRWMNISKEKKVSG